MVQNPQSMIAMQPMRDGVLILPEDPVEGTAKWLEDAKSAGLPEPTSMTLATATRDGRPSARIVLLKGISAGSSGQRGFEFFTNYESKKSTDLIANPFAALTFHWVVMRRQIRIEGSIEKLSAEESDLYFQSRPRESRLGAWSSPQSKVLSTLKGNSDAEGRAKLESLVKETREKFGDGPVPCPPFWGGFRLTPNRIEFWEERPFRLHERFEFRLVSAPTAGAKVQWTKSRLAP